MRLNISDFKPGKWQNSIDVQDFIQTNYTPYDGDGSFLCGASSKTRQLWETCRSLLVEEHLNGGILDIDTETVASINSHKPGFIDEKYEVIKGLQTDTPLKRAFLAKTGYRMAKQACQQFDAAPSPEFDKIFSKSIKTHNDGVFSAYTNEMRKARRCGVITGLPDTYGRGRIIGDYRRVALYGTDVLISQKQKDLDSLIGTMTDGVIRLREEIQDQIAALNDLAVLGGSYGFDMKRPALNAFEAVQWTYLAFLGALKETNGAANSLGRLNVFFDIFIQRDINNGILTEEDAQELIDQFVIKLRFIRHLRTKEYNELFAGDPVWLTESLGGMSSDGRHMVSKTSFRFLQTLKNLGAAPEPNLTILWSVKLPENFKKFCAEISIVTSAIQYENDDLMQPQYGDDYGISCCVSAMRLGKDMQFFGARCNLAKLLLLSLNGGRDEISGDQVAPEIKPYEGEYLEYEKVMKNFLELQDWLTGLYVDTMNIIHYMHDKYAYERLMMALHDTDVNRLMAFGISGLSVLVDSLSAIKHTRVRVVRDQRGIITDFELEGSYPQYGNNDDRADCIAKEVVTSFYNSLKAHPTYRNATHTLSILTITSNVVYGKKTGSTPDGRKKGEPFAPGANPMHNRDKSGILAMMNSVASIPYNVCSDGISLTLSVIPNALGKARETKISNLSALIDGYVMSSGHHINVNVLDKETLENAIKEPMKYNQLTVRVSGYAVHFVKLTKAQQLEVLSRTFHEAM
ncbi:formate C-acetyltransferase [Ruminiclostridium cellulolyticum]|uniref:Formate acetyltransferase n=1 Tax=Ruminiclostridium cellulolyticum (strain ATCC 35319 / DSM 5812 / JCM 6584 / H10) TaxID=394503 RepID=B8I4R2_RUMCH|nr:formate C-acetyltransferase [Ruminiclostridium cellulolyticum]ACL76566.1 formate acetyltransferase [Ruminiclostridium cellulolyticum H10]